jgi:hypothetical protein
MRGWVLVCGGMGRRRWESEEAYGVCVFVFVGGVWEGKKHCRSF